MTPKDYLECRWKALRFDPDYRRDYETLLAEYSIYASHEKGIWLREPSKQAPPERQRWSAKVRELCRKWGLREDWEWLPDPNRKRLPVSRLRGLFGVRSLSKVLRPPAEQWGPSYLQILKDLTHAQFIIAVYPWTTQEDIEKAWKTGARLFRRKERSIKTCVELDRTIWKLSKQESKSYAEIIEQIFPDELEKKIKEILEIERTAKYPLSEDFVKEKALRTLHPAVRDAKNRWKCKR